MTELKDWWASGVGRSSYTDFTTRTGKLHVYVRRHIADPTVMMIANVGTVSGWGASRTLYREFTKDIPTIAECILNPELDQMLKRWGWDHAYYDLADIPTRVNQAFVDRFPTAPTAASAGAAIMAER